MRCVDCREYAARWYAENPGSSSSSDAFPLGGMFYHGTVAGGASSSGPAAGPEGFFNSSSSDAVSYNSSNPEGLMAAGQIAYEREQRSQQRLDRDIALSIDHTVSGNDEMDVFMQLAELDAQQQGIEQYEEDVYNDLMDMEDAEERAQQLFYEEVYLPSLASSPVAPSAGLVAGPSRAQPSESSNGAACSSDACPAGFPTHTRA